LDAWAKEETQEEINPEEGGWELLNRQLDIINFSLSKALFFVVVSLYYQNIIFHHFVSAFGEPLIL
jgi:hypothetical protein